MFYFYFFPFNLISATYEECDRREMVKVFEFNLGTHKTDIKYAKTFPSKVERTFGFQKRKRKHGCNLSHQPQHDTK